jgi:hypothetical protein
LDVRIPGHRHRIDAASSEDFTPDCHAFCPAAVAPILVAKASACALPE